MVFKYIYIYLVSLSIYIYIYRYGSIYGPSINGWIISLYDYVIIWLNSLIIYYVIIIYIIELIHLTRKYEWLIMIITNWFLYTDWNV